MSGAKRKLQFCLAQGAIQELGLETDSAVVEDLRIDTDVYCFGASAGTIRRQSFTNLNVVRIVVIDAAAGY